MTQPGNPTASRVRKVRSAAVDRPGNRRNPHIQPIRSVVVD